MLRSLPVLSSCAISWLVASSWLMGCDKHQQLVQLPKDDIVVARVNGSSITRYDVEHLGNRSLGELATEIDSQAYPRLRQAAIQSRAISMAAEAELSVVEKLALDKEMAAHREQLLVRRYMNKHAPPSPVTNAMVEEYYRAHPDRFGAKTEQTYEILATTRQLAPAERDKLLESLKHVDDTADWAPLQKKLADARLPVTLTEAGASDSLLHDQLRELLQQLAPGKASPLTFVQGRAYVARIKGQTSRPPKPLQDVRADIERMLEPVTMSASIQKISEQVMGSAKVEIVEKPSPTKQGGAP